MLKDDIRKEVLDKLNTKDPMQRMDESRQLFKSCLELIKKQQYQSIGIYYGQFPELETYQLCDYLYEHNYKVLVPRVEKERQMTFREYRGEDSMELSNFGVYQPMEHLPIFNAEEIELLIVPGLAFKENGERIGFGGGYYDRFLEKFPFIPTVSMVFPEQIYPLNAWKIESHDILVNKIIQIGEADA